MKRIDQIKSAVGARRKAIEHVAKWTVAAHTKCRSSDEKAQVLDAFVNQMKGLEK